MTLRLPGRPGNTAVSRLRELGLFSHCRIRDFSRIGRFIDHGEWTGLKHQSDPNKNQDLRMLMRDGGSGWTIPFDLVKKFKEFSDKPPAH